MPHYESRFERAGDIEIPGEVRDFLALKEGDRVDFYIDAQSRSVRMMARNQTLSELLGSLDPGPSIAPVSQQQIDDSIGDYLIEKHDRISRQWDEWREFQEWKKAKAAE
jgi:bifunctional DNA-binding transcriptional regulator/antitoxin component of YhaV-PrlF toxin-antitoxin module